MDENCQILFASLPPAVDAAPDEPRDPNSSLPRMLGRGVGKLWRSFRGTRRSA
jgi:hypothetical protein